MNVTLRTICLIAVTAACATAARGEIPTARVGDLTHLQGQGRNVLIGVGLVTGLNKSGDGDDYYQTMQRVAVLMRRFGGSVESIADLKGTKNVAIVMLEAVIPENGAREGELLDVQVTALAAKSLAGGRLLSTPLVSQDHNIEELFAFAQGPITVNPNTPTVGTISRGARMEKDVFINVVATGTDLIATGLRNPWIQPGERYVTLVLDDAHAGWPMAAAVAQALDKELGIAADTDRVALAVDPKNVVVLLPQHQRSDPASWIRDVERTPLLMESNEARVTVNRARGTIVVSGDTRLSPVIVSQRGMTITVYNPLADGTVPVPPTDTESFVGLAAGEKPETNVSDLLEALNRLKVPFEERVSILEEIHRAGKLHAQIVYEQ